MNCIFQSIYITITKILWFLVIRTLIYERSDWLSSLIFCVKEETLPSTNYRALAYTINCIAGETDSRLRNWTRFDRVSFSPRIQRGDLRFLENGLWFEAEKASRESNRILTCIEKMRSCPPPRDSDSFTSRIWRLENQKVWRVTRNFWKKCDSFLMRCCSTWGSWLHLGNSKYKRLLLHYWILW